MATLNHDASRIAVAQRPNGLTDVTGFGLTGHLLEMCQASDTTAEIWCDALPLLSGADELARSGIVPGGTYRNLEYIAADTEWGTGVEEWQRLMCADPQTSGGLLVSLPPDRARVLVSELERGGVLAAAVVGRMLTATDRRLVILRSVGEEVSRAQEREA